jgi:hypothetical protein
MRNVVLVAVGVILGLVGAVAAARVEMIPDAGAQGAGAPATGGATIIATGGAMQNQTDLCWVMAKVRPARGPERTVLALYRAKRNGEFFDLEDVRMIDADLRVVEFKAAAHDKDTTVDAILKRLPKEEREPLMPPPRAPQGAGEK